MRNAGGGRGVAAAWTRIVARANQVSLGTPHGLSTQLYGESSASTSLSQIIRTHINIPLPRTLSTDPHCAINPSTRLVCMHFGLAPVIATATAIMPGVLYRLSAPASEGRGIQDALSYQVRVV
jgi:hypothetical protein